MMANAHGLERAVKHPFRVGERYRNRIGEYTVIELTESKMVTRFDDGREFTADIGIQARIWQNLLDDSRLGAPAHGPDMQFTASTDPESRGRDFHGLQETDFRGDILGTSWRARSSLGGLLAQSMSDATGREFESYPIYPYPTVHIAQPMYY